MGRFDMKRYFERLEHRFRGARGKYTWESPVFFGGPVQTGRRTHIGRFTYITSAKIYGNVRIGRFCAIAVNVVIGATTHPTS